MRLLEISDIITLIYFLYLFSIQSYTKQNHIFFVIEYCIIYIKTRESFLRKVGRKNTLRARKWASEGDFHPLRMAKREGEMRFFLHEKREIFRNKLTDLSNTKTRWRGRAWNTRRESVIGSFWVKVISGHFENAMSFSAIV